MEQPSWFAHHDFHTLVIKQYRSIANPRVLKSFVTHDNTLIQRVIARIEEIPTLADIKAVFDEKSDKMDIIFSNATETYVIEVLNHRFKIPTIASYAGNNEFEDALYEDLDTLIHPKRKKKFAKLQM